MILCFKRWFLERECVACFSCKWEGIGSVYRRQTCVPLLCCLTSAAFWALEHQGRQRHTHCMTSYYAYFCTIKQFPQCKKILRNVDCNNSASCSAFDEFKWFLVRNLTMPLRNSITGIAKIWRMFEWISMSTASAFLCYWELSALIKVTRPAVAVFLQHP